MELMSFGKSKGGIYRGQNGNDDLAMTSVNISSLFDSSQFWDVGIETFERQDQEYVKDLEEKIFNIHSNRSKSAFDYDELKRLNDNPLGKSNKKKGPTNVFDLETLDRIRKINDKFFKS